MPPPRSMPPPRAWCCHNVTFRAEVTMLVSASCTAGLLTILKSTAAKATAATVPTAYSAVVIPESLIIGFHRADTRRMSPLNDGMRGLPWLRSSTTGRRWLKSGRYRKDKVGPRQICGGPRRPVDDQIARPPHSDVKLTERKTAAEHTAASPLAGMT